MKHLLKPLSSVYHVPCISKSQSLLIWPLTYSRGATIKLVRSKQAETYPLVILEISFNHWRYIKIKQHHLNNTRHVISLCISQWRVSMSVYPRAYISNQCYYCCCCCCYCCCCCCCCYCCCCCCLPDPFQSMNKPSSIEDASLIIQTIN